MKFSLKWLSNLSTNGAALAGLVRLEIASSLLLVYNFRNQRQLHQSKPYQPQNLAHHRVL